MITSNRLYKIIVKKLDNSIPFSLVRFGDGEGMILSRDKEYTNFVLKRQLNYIPQNIDTIIENLIVSYIKSDIIGVVDKKMKVENKFWDYSLEFINKLNLKKELCSVEFNIHIMKNGLLNKLLRRTNELFYISCRDITKELYDKFPNIKKIESFIISPEMKWEIDKNKELHYPDQYEKIKQWIFNLNCTGKLCLVGGGVVSKIYNVWFKEMGGISLDIGSVFDYWAGRDTRGKNRGVDKTIDKYKL